jgi:hypothetical protein
MYQGQFKEREPHLNPAEFQPPLFSKQKSLDEELREFQLHVDINEAQEDPDFQFIFNTANLPPNASDLQIDEARQAILAKISFKKEVKESKSEAESLLAQQPLICLDVLNRGGMTTAAGELASKGNRLGYKLLLELNANPNWVVEGLARGGYFKEAWELQNQMSVSARWMGRGLELNFSPKDKEETILERQRYTEELIQKDPSCVHWMAQGAMMRSNKVRVTELREYHNASLEQILYAAAYCGDLEQIKALMSSLVGCINDAMLTAQFMSVIAKGLGHGGNKLPDFSAFTQFYPAMVFDDSKILFSYAEGVYLGGNFELIPAGYDFLIGLDFIYVAIPGRLSFITKKMDNLSDDLPQHISDAIKAGVFIDILAGMVRGAHRNYVDRIIQLESSRAFFDEITRRSPRIKNIYHYSQNPTLNDFLVNQAACGEYAEYVKYLIIQHPETKARLAACLLHECPTESHVKKAFIIKELLPLLHEAQQLEVFIFTLNLSEMIQYFHYDLIEAINELFPNILMIALRMSIGKEHSDDGILFLQSSLAIHMRSLAFIQTDKLREQLKILFNETVADRFIFAEPNLMHYSMKSSKLGYTETMAQIDPDYTRQLLAMHELYQMSSEVVESQAPRDSQAASFKHLLQAHPGIWLLCLAYLDVNRAFSPLFFWQFAQKISHDEPGLKYLILNENLPDQGEQKETKPDLLKLESFLLPTPLLDKEQLFSSTPFGELAAIAAPFDPNEDANDFSKISAFIMVLSSIQARIEVYQPPALIYLGLFEENRLKEVQRNVEETIRSISKLVHEGLEQAYLPNDYLATIVTIQEKLNDKINLLDPSLSDYERRVRSFYQDLLTDLEIGPGMFEGITMSPESRARSSVF